ncbi:hypothetical protein BGX38DRAFT_1202559, partial [Terfezia claveryi]
MQKEVKEKDTTKLYQRKKDTHKQKKIHETYNEKEETPQTPSTNNGYQSLSMWKRQLPPPFTPLYPL